MLQEMLRILGERDAGVLAVNAMRWGLLDGQPKTLDEVGRHFDVSRDRIRRIEQRALEKLRQEVSDSPLLVIDDGQVVGFVDVRRSGDSPSPISREANLILCPQCQQRQFLPESGQFYGGRPRKYCSARCRQAAYRARRAAGGEQRRV
jgi:Sigma-70, region 4